MHKTPPPVSIACAAPPVPALPRDRRVSVIIPVYNAEAFIADALDSVITQTYRSLEIIVVNDGSTDRTPEIVEAYQAKDARVQLIHQPNQGVGAARNTAIEAASGEYLAPIDADDVWMPEKIAQQVAIMEDGPIRRGFVYCWSRYMTPDGRLGSRGMDFKISGSAFNALLFRNFVGNASVPLFRTSLVRQLGGYRTRSEQNGVQGCEDWDLCLRIAADSPVGVVEDYLVGYRKTSHSMSNDYASMVASYEFSMREVRAAHRNLPPNLLRWSEANFYRYMLLTSYRDGRPRENLHRLTGLLRRDPIMFFSPLPLLVSVTSLAKASARIVPGLSRSHTPVRPNAQKPERSETLLRLSKLLFKPIQLHRWNRVQNYDLTRSRSQLMNVP